MKIIYVIVVIPLLMLNKHNTGKPVLFMSWEKYDRMSHINVVTFAFYDEPTINQGDSQ